MSDKHLTVEKLKKIISEEKKKLKDQGLISVDTVEDAWSGGKNLVNQVDFIKKLGIKESIYRKKAEKLAKLRRALKDQVKKEIKNG
jgi:hypothetical protein